MQEEVPTLGLGPYLCSLALRSAQVVLSMEYQESARRKGGIVHMSDSVFWPNGDRDTPELCDICGDATRAKGSILCSSCRRRL